MRKKVLIALVAAVVLVTGAFGGFVYADSEHEAMKGDKLVGFGPFGLKSRSSGDTQYSTTYSITNPDCVGTITLEQLSIYNSKTNTLIYEGPVLKNSWVKSTNPTPPPTYIWGMESEVVSELGPHETTVISLTFYFPIDGPHNPTEWMSPSDARAQDSAQYTVEVMWSAKGWNCSPIGYKVTTQSRYDTEDNLISETRISIPMWNIQQRQD